MTTFLFILCAVLGGTILVCQFVLTLVGFGHDVGDLGHDGSVDVHTDVHMDAHTGDDHSQSPQHDSSWLFGVISFRTLVAAAAFFGLAGLASESAGPLDTEGEWAGTVEQGRDPESRASIEFPTPADRSEFFQLIGRTPATKLVWSGADAS